MSSMAKMGWRNYSMIIIAASRLLVLGTFLLPLASSQKYNSDVTNLLTAKKYLGASTYLSTWETKNPICSWKGSIWGFANGSSLNCEDSSVSGNTSLAQDGEVFVTSLQLGALGLNGTLADELSQLSQLSTLNLRENLLTGSIPLTLGTSLSLAYLNLSRNQLAGSIPSSLWNLCSSRLTELSLDSNFLSNAVPDPANPTTCPSLTVLELQNNQLSGPIPSFFGDFSALNNLNLRNNSFSGEIPQTLTQLTNLTDLDVSYNNLIGPIPAFKSTYNANSFVGNTAFLCGSPLNVSCGTVQAPSSTGSPSPGGGVGDPPGAGGPPGMGGMGPPGFRPGTGGMDPKLVAGIIIGSLSLFVILGSLLIGWTQARSRVRDDKSALQEEYRRELEEGEASAETGKIVHFEGGDKLTAEDVLNATGEVLGKTSYGTVYKAKLANGYTIALRLLREGTARDRQEFVPAIQELGLIRHRNLVPLRAYYSGPKEEKLLVYDFMPRGSLTDLLHSTAPGRASPGWARRHKILLGAARGLAYLHTGLSSPIIHGNLKSKNILVDDNFVAHLSDYGLEKLMIPAATAEVITAASTQGYKAPELLKLKRANTKTDIFSFGIVMLELLTGKKPGKSPESDEIVDLPTMVKAAVLEERTLDLFDYELIRGSMRTPSEDGLLHALQLAMGCCAPVPLVRPDINEVIRQLEDIRPKAASSMQSPLYTPDSASTRSREAFDY